MGEGLGAPGGRCSRPVDEHPRTTHSRRRKAKHGLRHRRASPPARSLWFRRPLSLPCAVGFLGRRKRLVPSFYRDLSRVRDSTAARAPFFVFARSFGVLSWLLRFGHRLSSEHAARPPSVVGPGVTNPTLPSLPGRLDAVAGRGPARETPRRMPPPCPPRSDRSHHRRQ